PAGSGGDLRAAPVEPGPQRKEPAAGGRLTAVDTQRIMATAPETFPPVRLQLVNVTKSFPSASQIVHALGPTNLEIREGECVVLFGPSGCGKSTLLNLLAGFEEPSSGEITLDGVTVEGPANERLMLFQEHALFPWLKVIDNVMYGLKWEPG